VNYIKQGLKIHQGSISTLVMNCELVGILRMHRNRDGIYLHKASENKEVKMQTFQTYIMQSHDLYYHISRANKWLQ
jgi:hypothetical protein